MILVQCYATVNELVTDLKLSGEEPGLLERIQTASRHFANLCGNFIPYVQKRRFFPTYYRGLWLDELRLDPAIAVEEVADADAVAVAATDYELRPVNRHWANGPYTGLWSEDVVWDEDGVDVTAYWGLWEDIRQLNISGVTINISATSMAVSNGSQVSPGMVILLDHEQVYVKAGNGGGDSPAATAAVSLLNGAITADDEEITVDNGAEFFRGEVIQLSTEDVRIERIAGNVLVCRRGWNGTTKAAHANDLAMAVYRTFTVERAVNGTPAEAHAAAEAWKYVVPEDVNWIVRQVAGLMRQKAAVGFASKAGNAELGETYYFNEFPNQIQKIREHYRCWWD